MTFRQYKCQVAVDTKVTNKEGIVAKKLHENVAAFDVQCSFSICDCFFLGSLCPVQMKSNVYKSARRTEQGVCRVQHRAVAYMWQQWHNESETKIDQMKQPGLVNSALIFNTTYNWYSIYRKFNHPADGLETQGC